MLEAYFDELEKIAKTRAMREIEKSPRVADQYVQGMRSGKIRARESVVRHLGSGSYQHADLTVGPDFGLAVRKHYPKRVPSTGEVSALNRELGDRSYRHVAGLLGVRGSGDPKDSYRYWEYAPGKSQKPNPVKKPTMLGKRLMSYLSGGSEHRRRRAEQHLQAIINRADRTAQPAVSPGVVKDVRRIERRIGKPLVDWDNLRNVVGGRLVDVDTSDRGSGTTERKMFQHVLESRRASSVHTPVGRRRGGRSLWQYLRRRKGHA